MNRTTTLTEWAISRSFPPIRLTLPPTFPAEPTRTLIGLAFDRLAARRLKPRKRPRALPPSLPPRLLSRLDAAAYAGMSPGSYDKLVEAGVMPAPLKVPTIRRKVVDRLALERACTTLATGAPGSDDDNPWDRVLLSGKT